jgi:hypothetical protein
VNTPKLINKESAMAGRNQIKSPLDLINGNALKAPESPTKKPFFIFIVAMWEKYFKRQ